MLTKEEYIDIIDFLDFFYGDNLIATAELRKIKSEQLQKECVVNFKSKLDKLKQLIKEHFDNSMDFKHFKLHSDSTLKSFKKDELIDCIHMLYKNWQGTDSVWENAVKMNYKLQSEIDELKSNPPLKFEEIKEGMWVWDNKEKWWRNIVIVFESCNEYPLGSFKTWANSDETSKDFIEFEKKRFYRKQVLYE